MKNILIFILLAILSTSCMKDVLDKKPLDMIPENDVFADKDLMEAYLANVYANMYILTNETPNNSIQDLSDHWNGPFIINEMADESKTNFIWGWSAAKYGNLRIGGGLLEWWEFGYRCIRDLNFFIENIAESPIDEAYRKSRLAEARFLRAFNYFAMVKRYGGVPLITEVQGINDAEEKLFPKRATEKEIYDFVIQEMDQILPDLVPVNSGIDFGRPSKTAALALKCRAALYAASVSKYGEVQLDGVVGIPAEFANGYYTTAMESAQAIISSGIHALYNQDADKVTNFKNIFLKKNNSEAIFVRKYGEGDKRNGGNGWGYDFYQCPKPHAWNAGNQNAPYLEMVEAFEYLDGTPGKLDRGKIQTGLWTMEEFLGGRDPRLYATIYKEGDVWQGAVIDWHNGLITPSGSVINTGTYEGVPAIGTQHVGNNFGTGFGVMKYLNESKSNMDLGSIWASNTDWIVFRYAEVYLNLAEAAIEKGETQIALNAVNEIRKRAGVALRTNISIAAVRHERKVELAFEGHRYWDLRRWRTAEHVLTRSYSGIQYILDYTTRKLKLRVIENIDGTVQPPLFRKENYYFPITLARTANNKNLLENPGYN